MDTGEPVIDVTMPVPEGAIILRAMEIVQYLNADGQEVVAARWQGTGNVVAELGMLEYAKQELIGARFLLADEDDPNGSL